jgi:hypothetical protein
MRACRVRMLTEPGARFCTHAVNIPLKGKTSGPTHLLPWLSVFTCIFLFVLVLPWSSAL